MSTGRLPAGWVPPVAGRQAGLFTRRQALEAGATSGQVRRRRENGAWVTVVGDALAPRDRRVDAWVQAQAAGLTWPDAVVCLASAAALHGFPVAGDPDVHVIVNPHRAGRGGLVTHQLRVDRREVVRFGLARVTSRQRTLFDCLGRLPEQEAEHLLAWAVTREALSRTELERALRDRPHWWGNRGRRRALAESADGALSAAERRLHALLRGAGIVGWAADQPVRDDDGRVVARVDVLFGPERLVIEVDGFAYHGRGRFQQDRTRQNALVAAGYTVLRFTWADLTDRPHAVVDQVTHTLALLRAR